MTPPSARTPAAHRRRTAGSSCMPPGVPHAPGTRGQLQPHPEFCAPRTGQRPPLPDALALRLTGTDRSAIGPEHLSTGSRSATAKAAQECPPVALEVEAGLAGTD